jgi:hypothetical protein
MTLPETPTVDQVSRSLNSISTRVTASAPKTWTDGQGSKEERHFQKCLAPDSNRNRSGNETERNWVVKFGLS